MSETDRRTRRGRVALAWPLLALAGFAVTLTLGYLVKERCLRHPWDGFQYRSSCYNDIYALSSFRGLDQGVRPYIDGNGIDDGPDGDLEYPVGTGYVVWIAAALSSDGVGFFYANVVLLGMFGMLAAVMLIALTRERWRLLLVFAAPSVVLYAFHNWDLLPMFLVLAAILAWQSGHTTATGIALGVGAAAKVYPGILLPAFLLAEGRRSGRVPWRMIYGAGFAFVVLNLPILVANPAGWLFPWRFQSERMPNFETHWFFISRHLGDGSAFWREIYPQFTSVASGLLFVVGMVVLLRRANARPVVRPIVLSASLITLWLLTAKVYSPQFSLWLLPFFALIAIPKRVWVGFIASDAAVWIAISFFFLAQQGTVSAELRLWIVEVAVLARYGLLIWLLRVLDRADEVVRTPLGLPGRRTSPPPGPARDREEAEAA